MDAAPSCRIMSLVDFIVTNLRCGSPVAQSYSGSRWGDHGGSFRGITRHDATRPAWIVWWISLPHSRVPCAVVENRWKTGRRADAWSNQELSVRQVLQAKGSFGTRVVNARPCRGNPPDGLSSGVGEGLGARPNSNDENALRTEVRENTEILRRWRITARTARDARAGSCSFNGDWQPLAARPADAVTALPLRAIEGFVRPVNQIFQRHRAVVGCHAEAAGDGERADTR